MSMYRNIDIDIIEFFTIKVNEPRATLNVIMYDDFKNGHWVRQRLYVTKIITCELIMLATEILPTEPSANLVIIILLTSQRRVGKF